MLLKNPITEDKTIWAGLNHPELPLEEADIAVFGIPYDGGVSFRSGTCEAPQELRKITHTISPTTEDFRDISPVKVKDLGDCVGKDRDEMFAEAEELAYQAVKAGKFFTMIGGDHSVTIPVHRASTGRWRRTSVSSTSTPTSISATRCTGHSVPRLHRAAATELSHVGDSDHLYFLGIRSIESDELEFYQNNKINVLSAADVDHLGVPAALERMVSHMKRFSKVYITLDIDCLDPAYAAGTRHAPIRRPHRPAAPGPAEGPFDGLNIIGMDVVEVAPRLDPSLAALFAAGKLLPSAGPTTTSKPRPCVSREKKTNRIKHGLRFRRRPCFMCSEKLFRPFIRLMFNSHCGGIRLDEVSLMKRIGALLLCGILLLPAAGASGTPWPAWAAEALAGDGKSRSAGHFWPRRDSV